MYDRRYILNGRNRGQEMILQVDSEAQHRLDGESQNQNDHLKLEA